ncbi:type II/IV secretion system protein [Aquincola sp. S2]|uniref:Type II/IV secretion system protein n=1 Tax=Pseudaquabacterium terrae TaxID=2732868 RepID=A0ABX2ER31_9BURK|nr:GspE/PulE family protein [Aquabacterium terrae]NRF71116.1 type II/IV secretion system protein [Aquabacterium terrae]
MTRPQRVRLGDLLVQAGLITTEQLGQALAAQRGTDRRLGRTLIDKGWVDDVQIAQVLAQQLRAPFVDMSRRSVPEEVARLLPETQARRLRALPLDQTATTVRVGMADPTDLAAYDEIARILKREIELAVVAEGQLLSAIDRSYRHGDDISGLARELGSELASAQEDLGDLLGLNTTSSEDAPVVRLLYSVFAEALRVRASDIHIEPQERHLRIRYRIDGVLHVQTEADPKIANAVALRLKLMSGLDISERRLPQDGRFAVKLRAGAIDVRISTLPTQFGESVVMRLLDQGGGLLSMAGLKLPPRVADALQRALRRPSGMLLVTGPTGSGKTTTLYAALQALNSTERKIVTVEDPVEYRLPGLNQVQVLDKIELGFDRVLRAALRQDPDVILVGEMRDRNTAEIGMRAALTGHLVLSTLHTNDAAGAPVRLLDMGVPRYMVALTLQLVLAQRLIRLVCPHCAVPHVPDAQEQAWLDALATPGELAQARLKRAPGCSECNHTGHLGRTGVYEFIEMTRALVAALHDADPAVFTEAARRQIGSHTLARGALALVLEGRSTIEDAMRIGSADDA